jgi:hypothetical protein
MHVRRAHVPAVHANHAAQSWSAAQFEYTHRCIGPHTVCSTCAQSALVSQPAKQPMPPEPLRQRYGEHTCVTPVPVRDAQSWSLVQCWTRKSAHGAGPNTGVSVGDAAGTRHVGVEHSLFARQGEPGADGVHAGMASVSRMTASAR